MSITDWDQRLLCADGACVGVIGPDGTCKMCGRVAPNWGDERRRGLKSTGEVKLAKAAASVAPPAEDGEHGEDELDQGEDGDDESAELAAGEEKDDDGDGDGGSAGDDEGEDEDDDDDGEDDDEDDDGDGDDDADEGEDPEGIIQAKTKTKSKGAADDRASSDPDWRERKLCTNGACIGVIGSNGRCKTCGKTA